MPESAPVINVDRISLNAAELQVAARVLYPVAEMVNALTRAGAIYGQLVPQPDERARKQGGV